MSANLRKYLDPDVLARITRLDLRARVVVEGFISGMHASPFHGFSVEFASHREYVPGDDIKHIDWKVHARTDRYVIKQYEQETNLRATFVVDGSESMRYRPSRPGALSKFHYSSSLACALSLLLLRQQDAVSLALFDEELKTYLAPSSNPNQINNLVGAFEAFRGVRKTSLEGTLSQLVGKLSGRGLVCIISDLLVDAEGLARAIGRLRHDNHDIVVLHVMDDDELTFPFKDNIMFRGLEESSTLLARGPSVRAGYLAEMREFTSLVKRQCLARGAYYKLISTSDHLDSALGTFLSGRRAAMRRGGK